MIFMRDAIAKRGKMHVFVCHNRALVWRLYQNEIIDYSSFSLPSRNSIILYVTLNNAAYFQLDHH